ARERLFCLPFRSPLMVHLFPSMSRLFLLASLSLVLLAGCATNNTYQTREFPVSGGKKIWVAFNERGALPAKNNDVEVELVGFSTDKEKMSLTYRFIVKFFRDAPPKKVVVQDISDETPETLVTDEKPQVMHGIWGGLGQPKTKDDP